MGGLILQLTVGFNTIFGTKTPTKGNQAVLAGQNQTPTLKPSQEEPTKPQKELKRTDLKIRVENGNGLAGSAGKLKAYLEGFGYNVATVGNSDRSDYTKTTVKLPKDFADYKELITNDLKTNYSVEISNVENKFTDYDILVIAGAN
jgi:FtsZ-interacting cell division protein YlmF